MNNRDESKKIKLDGMEEISTEGNHSESSSNSVLTSNASEQFSSPIIPNKKNYTGQFTVPSFFSLGYSVHKDRFDNVEKQKETKPSNHSPSPTIGRFGKPSIIAPLYKPVSEKEIFDSYFTKEYFEKVNIRYEEENKKRKLEDANHNEPNDHQDKKSKSGPSK